MQPIRMHTAIEMRLFTSGKASSSSPVLVLKVPIDFVQLLMELVAFVELIRWLEEGGMLRMIGQLALFDLMALMRSCRWLLWEFKVAMSSCRLAGVWFEDEVVEVVMVAFLSL